MRKSFIMALVGSTVALTTPPAHAEHATFDCGFDAISQETVTGGEDAFTGVAYGYVAEPTGENVSVRCFLTVDGTEATSTPTSTGTGTAVTAGQVTYTAADTQVVELCADWSAGYEYDTTCFGTTTPQIPPQEVTGRVNTCVGVKYGQGSCEAVHTVTSASSTNSNVKADYSGSEILWDCYRDTDTATIYYTTTVGGGSFYVIC